MLRPTFLWVDAMAAVYRVSVNRAALKERLRVLIHSHIAAAAMGVTHTNRDGTYSPSRWFAGDFGDFSNRHAMVTDGSMSFAAGKLTVELTYTVVDWPQW